MVFIFIFIKRIQLLSTFPPSLSVNSIGLFPRVPGSPAPGCGTESRMCPAMTVMTCTAGTDTPATRAGKWQVSVWKTKTPPARGSDSRAAPISADGWLTSIRALRTDASNAGYASRTTRGATVSSTRTLLCGTAAAITCTG